MERMETRLIRELARLSMLHAQQQQEIFRLTMQTTGEPDRILMAEWKGQEIAFKRMYDTIGGGQ